MKHKVSQQLLQLFASFTTVFFGLLFGLILLFLFQPQYALSGFIALLTGGFQDGSVSIASVLFHAVPIIMTGLSVGFAFQSGLFNIGTPGQFIVGGFAAVWVGVTLDFLPSGIHWLVALLAGMIAGGIWALLPGIWKAYFQVHEVISSIMMNYIGMYLVNYLVSTFLYDTQKAQSLPVATSALIPRMGVQYLLPNTNLNGGIFIVLFSVFIIYVLMQKTTFGFALKACGKNRLAAASSGIKDKRNLVVSMVVAGMLAGIGGALLYLGGSGKYISVVEEFSPEGFNGIAVALLGMAHPIGILFAGLFIAYINYGGFVMQLYGFVPQIVDMIIACIIYFAAFSGLAKLWIWKWRSKNTLRKER